LQDLDFSIGENRSHQKYNFQKCDLFSHNLLSLKNQNYTSCRKCLT